MTGGSLCRVTADKKMEFEFKLMTLNDAKSQ